MATSEGQSDDHSRSSLLRLGKSCPDIKLLTGDESLVSV
jgi:hypothetical protein